MLVVYDEASFCLNIVRKWHTRPPLLMNAKVTYKYFQGLPIPWNNDFHERAVTSYWQMYGGLVVLKVFLEAHVPEHGV